MKKIIHSITDEEHVALQVGQQRTFSVRMSMSIKPSNGEVINDADALLAYVEFVDMVAGLSGKEEAFSIRSWDRTTLVEIGPDQYEIVAGTDDTTLRAAFKTWIAKRNKELATIGRSPDATDDAIDEEVAESEITGFHVLMGAAGWTAPIPQTLGLAFLVTTTVTGLPEGSSLVVIPKPPGATFPKDVSVHDPEKKLFTVTYADSVYFECQASVSDVAVVGNTLLGGDGFIQKGPDESFGQTIRRIEQRAGGLFTGYLAASQILWPEYPPAADAGQKHRFDLACVAWQAASILGAAFDTLLIAILMPGKAKRDGQLLAPFLDLLVKEGIGLAPEEIQAQSEAAKFASKTAAERRSEYRRVIREGVAGFIAKKRSDKSAAALKDVWTLAGFEANEAPIAKALVQGAMGLDSLEVTDSKIKDALGLEKREPTLNRDDLARRMTAEFAPLHDKLLSEEGTERAFVTLLGFDEVKTQVLDLWVPKPSDDAIGKGYEILVSRLKGALAQSLNGAEAARQSVGSLLVDLATDGRQQSEQPLDHINKKITCWVFWKKRLFDGEFSPVLPATGSTEPLIHLPSSLSSLLDGVQNIPEQRNEAGDVVRPEMAAYEFAKMSIDSVATAMQKDVLDRLFPPDTARFVPDPTPAPLLVPIALDTHTDDDDGIDEFTASFSGLGVLVREKDGDWAHACLAEIRNPEEENIGGTTKLIYTPPEPLLSDFAVAPLPSAVVDGRRELFITYTGEPFTSFTHGHVLPEAADGAPPQFHLLDYPEAAGAFTSLPPLAYGREFEFAAFAVGRCGTLPESLRKSGDKPWIPNPTPLPAPAIATTANVSRRTAIGRIGLADVEPDKRIGCWPEDVLPLTCDYPRIVVEPDIAVDVFRDGDGVGTIKLPHDVNKSTTVVLDAIEVWSDTNATLTIIVGTMPNESAITAQQNVAQLVVYLETGKTHTVAMAITRTEKDTIEIDAGNQLETLTVDDHKTAWMQLKSNAAISLAAPNRQAGGGAPEARPETADLLLLGTKSVVKDSKDGGDWIAPYGNSATIEISFPRMTFQDFMRWTNNDELVRAALGGEEQPERDKRFEIFRKFRVLLVALDMERLESPGVAKLLDALPDLAVRAIRVSATPTDSLVLEPGTMGKDNRARSRGALRVVVVPTLWDLLGTKENKEELDRSVEDLHKAKIVGVLSRMNNALRRRVSINATTPIPTTKTSGGNPPLGLKDPGGDNPLELTVPGGLVVRLSARPLVPKAHFKDFKVIQSRPPVIDDRLLQHAVGTIGTDHVFDGAHLVVETMISPLVRSDKDATLPNWCLSREAWAVDRAKLLIHVAAGSARRYHLETTPDPRKDWRWRQVGTITTRTQTWRFTGRPIYSWIDPWEHVEDGDKARSARHATLPLKVGGDPLKDFEDELFVGRDDGDARPRTVRLLPLGHATRLVEMVADEPKGATLHRHALELRSRYAGAMKRPDATGTTVTWNKNEWFDRWFRIAVLARRPEGEITRPQLRALLPLTRRPDAIVDSAAIAPPVLAILQEEPLAHGGLATRVVSEIRTGIGYEASQQASLPTETKKVLFAPADARREIGPDPRLSYRPMPKEVAQLVTLPQEGPIGLTFDRDADSTAGFANTALVLHPETPGGVGVKNLEEYFVSVALRRYLDPAWLVPDAPAVSIDPTRDSKVVLPLDRGPLLIDAKTGFRLGFEVDPTVPPSTHTETSLSAKSSFDFLWIEAAENKPTLLMVDRRAIDPTAAEQIVSDGSDPNPLIPCAWNSSDGIVSFLMVPAHRSRLSFTAILLPTSPKHRTRASGLGPVVLTTIECVIPEGRKILATGVDKIRSTATSTTTALNWVRTNQDFEQVSTVAADNDLARVPVVRLRASLSAKELSFSDNTNKASSNLWIRAAQSIARTPTETQRHMVVLLSSTLRGRGRDIEQPIGAWLMPGSKAHLPSETKADKVRLVEIETPARIAAWMANKENIPDPYRHAYFDLVSIGQQVLDKPKHVLFRLRQVGPGSELPKGAKINAKLHLLPRQSFEDGRLIEIEIGTLKNAAVDLLLAFDIQCTAVPVLSKMKVLSISATDGILTCETCTATPTTVTAGVVDALALSIETLTVQGFDVSETWFEVSMLVSPAAEAQDSWRFDFDWLFGDNADGATAADFAGFRLAGLVEAQARVVAVSPPIEVER